MTSKPAKPKGKTPKPAGPSHVTLTASGAQTFSNTPTLVTTPYPVRRSNWVKFQVYRDALHQWRWRLRSRNGRILADSAEGYTKRAHCLKMVGLIQGSALYSTVEIEEAK